MSTHLDPQAEVLGAPEPPLPLPSAADVLNRISGLIAAKKYDETQALIQQALAKDPSNGDLINAYGCVYTAMGRHREALKWYRDALEFSPDGTGIWNNLGTAFKHLKYFNAAIACYQRAISLSGEEAFVHHNLGLCYSEAGQHGEAIAAFNRAIALRHDYHLARWDRARSYLFLGNYRQGWADYEVRLISGQIPARQSPGRKWTGTPYAGRRLVLLTEQGFGDTLWVLRYLSTVKALGGELIVECQRPLCSLIESLGLADQVIAHGEPLPQADYYCYQCSLPGLFSPDAAHLPAQPYLPKPSDRQEKFAPYLQRGAGRLKVGIVWSGSITFGRNADRALPLERLLQAVDFPGIQLYSLQKGPPEQELKSLSGQGRSIIDLGPELQDFADTAAVVSNLDLVIMTDSSVAHLAGGLGVPVWILLGHSAHWLWLLDRADSPWYPSARLFRARVEGDWDYVLDKVSMELIEMVTNKTAS